MYLDYIYPAGGGLGGKMKGLGGRGEIIGGEYIIKVYHIYVKL